MKNKTVPKIVGLGIITLVFSGLFWYAVRQAGLLNLVWESETLWGIGVAILLFCIFVALVSIFCLLVKDLTWLLTSLFAFCLPYLFFFPFDIYALTNILFLTLIFWYYGFQIRKERKERIKFSGLKITHFGLRTVILVVLIAVSLTYYGQMVRKGDSSETIVNNVIKSTTDLSMDLLNTQLDDFDPDMTLDDFIRNFGAQDIVNIFPEGVLPEEVTNQIFESYGISPQQAEGLIESETSQGLVGETTEQLEEEVVVQIRKELLKQFGIVAQGSDRMGDILTRLVSTEVNRGIQPFERYIPLIITLSLFFVLITFFFIYHILIRIFIAFFVAILLATGFAKKVKEVREAEVVILE